MRRGPDLVERVGGPGDDVEAVEDAFGLRAPAEHAPVDPSRPVAGDHPDGGAPAVRERPEEQVEDLLPVPVVHPDDAPPVVVDDHGHVRVTLPVAGLVHANGTQPVEQAHAPFGAKIVGDALADRAHALPVDAHQAAHGAARHMHARLGDLPFEVARVRAFLSRPRHHRDGHPMLRARHAHGRVLRRQPRAVDVEVTPTACAQTVVPAAMLPASGASGR